MKITKLVFIAFFIMFLNMLHGEKIDQLNPQDYRDSLKLKKLLDRIASKKWNYDIKVKRIKGGGGRGYTAIPVYYRFEYYIKLPDFFRELRAFLEKNRNLRKRPYRRSWSSWGNAEFYKYIYKPKYSFYICLFLLYNPKHHMGPSVETLLPLVLKDKEMWNDNITNWPSSLIRMYSVESAYYYYYPKELFLNILPKKYRNLLRKNPKYSLDGFGGYVKKIKGKFIWDERSKKKFIPFERIIDTYKKRHLRVGRGRNRRKVDYSTIAPNVDNLKNWLQFIFNVDKKEMLINLEVFIAYLRAQKTLEPIFPVSMMALFIVKGYTFDPKTGNYIPNEAGEKMLDYIVGTPVKDNVERLKIIMNGGNEQLIKSLMKKYKTTEKWNKFTIIP